MDIYKERAKRLEEYIHNLFQMFQSGASSCLFEEEDKRYRNLLFILTQDINAEYRKVNDEILIRKMQPVREYIKEYIIEARNDRSGDDSTASNE